MKRFLIFLLFLLLLVGLLGAGSFLFVNYYLVPNVAVPRVVSYLNSLMGNDLKLSVGEVTSEPFRMLVLRDIQLEGKAYEGKTLIIKADELNMVVDLWALLDRRVKVNKIQVENAELNIIRDKKGKWNIEPLAMLANGTGESYVLVNHIAIENSSVNFLDRFNKRNKLDRRFVDVDLRLWDSEDSKIDIKISGATDKKQKEHLKLDLDYMQDDHSIKGRASIDTSYFRQYWDYYLDDLLSPWRLDTSSVSADLDFSYDKNILKIDGDYLLEDAFLRYGDWGFKGKARVKHKQTVNLARTWQNKLNVELETESLALLIANIPVIAGAKGSALITEKEIVFKKIIAQSDPEQKIDMTGRYVYSPAELFLKGSLGQMENDFHLLMPTPNSAKLDWKVDLKDKFTKFKIWGVVDDIKDLDVDAKFSGSLDFDEMEKVDLTVELASREVSVKKNRIKVDLGEDDLRGRVEFAGGIRGELDKPSTLNGTINMKLSNFAFLAMKPTSFDLNFAGKSGVFWAEIPPLEFYNGSLNGLFMYQLSTKRWGAKLYLRDFDLESFAVDYPELKGCKGRFTLNLACVGDGFYGETMKGGGYFKSTNCDLRSLPLFKELEEGVKDQFSPSFSVPVFEQIEGNFNIKDEKVTIENASCKAYNMLLGLSGDYSFDRTINITAWMKLTGGDWLKTLRQIVLPMTIPFDILANSIQVNLSGKIPDVKQTVVVKPMSWINELFSETPPADPDKYSLKDLIGN
ncbi:MAG: AsmA family protein [Candidatus Margulisiibacteriota bacterium]|nr:hypothetical protein [Candidatus Margulisiibacteriota bacterium]